MSRGFRAIVTALAFGLASTAQAQDTAAPAPLTPPAAEKPAPTRVEIEQAIREQKARKSGAISGYVIGGIVIFAGIVKTAIDTVDEAEAKEARGDYSDTPYDYTGLGIGVLVAAPIFIVSGLTHADADREIRRIRRQSRSVGLAPARDGATVTVALEFGGGR